MTEVSKKALIVGFGVTGLSVARYLKRHGRSFEIADSRACLPDSLLNSEPDLASVPFHGGGWSAELFQRFDQLIVSPGVATRTINFRVAAESGVEVVGDVELFARAVQKPVVAVTGSNGKSTVVGMVGSLLRAAGLRVAVIGNIGVACLEGLVDEAVDVYVLELSSFQLETTVSLKPVVASVLNVSEDHMDRYDDIDDYAQTKRRIYRNAEHRVANSDDQRTFQCQREDATTTTFSMSDTAADWQFHKHLGRVELCGPDNIVVPSTALSVGGGHNHANALAAMALASIVLRTHGIQDSAIYEAGLQSFQGLPHRTELVHDDKRVRWFNDSKGTNVGACVSAINGMEGPVVLIAGGRGKNAEFTPLRKPVQDKCRAVILIGEDAEKIQQAIGESVPVYRESELGDAVQRAAQLAVPGDCVLLSPACASFDMFENFEARGSAFTSEVMKLCA